MCDCECGDGVLCVAGEVYAEEVGGQRSDTGRGGGRGGEEEQLEEYFSERSHTGERRVSVWVV